MPVPAPRALAVEAFNLVYHIPGLTYSDVAGWDIKRRRLWLELLSEQRELEEKELEKLNRK